MESTKTQVKQEMEEREATGAAGALVAAEIAAPIEEVTVRIDKAKLHCPVCFLPFKPPIYQFQCAARHLACSSCHARLPKDHCHACGHTGAYLRNTILEDVVGWHKVLCPYDVYGCRTFVTYHEAADHQRACPCAPCCCPEPGCGFLGSPPMLRDHLAAAPHSWPVDSIRYGKAHHLRLSESQPRRLLVAAEDDGRVFVVAAAALWGAYHGASVACVRASAAAGPQYTCTMWATGHKSAASGRAETTMVQAFDVPSSSVPGDAAATEEAAWPLVVRRKNLHGASKAMRVIVKIDKVQA